MQKVQRVHRFMLLCICMCALNCAHAEAGAHKPVISGNYQQGWRLYDEEAGSGDDYFFQESWVKWKQNFTSQSYYYVKFRIYKTDFAFKNQYDSVTIDLNANYTQQITKPLRLKTEMNIRDKNYPEDLTKKYYEVSGKLEISLKPGTKDQLGCTVKIQREFYPQNDKDNLLSGLTLNWERKLAQGISVHSGCAVTRENYLSEIALTDKMRYSISIGFEYQL